MIKNFIIRENIKFICLFSFILSLITFLSYLTVNQVFNQAFNQVEYLEKSPFRWTYVTTVKMPVNSFYNLENKKSFYHDINLSNRILSSSLMLTDGEYYTDSILNPFNLISGRVTNIDVDEVVITKDIANNHNISIDSVIYSKSIVSSITKMYRVVGIINNIYTVEPVINNIMKGILFFGYDSSIESNLEANYQNYSQQDPTNLLVNCQGCLVKIYSRDQLSKNPIESLLIYSILLSSIYIPLILVLYNFLFKDGFTNYRRLIMLGSNRLFLLSYMIRSFLFFSFSSLFLIIFSYFSTLFINVYFVSYFWFFFFILLLISMLLYGKYLIKKVKDS